MLIQNCGLTKKEHYAILQYFLYCSIAVQGAIECKVQDTREERKVLLVFLLLASRLTLSAMTDRQS